MDPWAVIQKASQECGSDTSSCPGPYPMAACPEFHIGCRLGPYAAPYAHGAMGCDQKSFIILVMWRWHQLLSDSLTKGRLSQVSHTLGRKLFRLPSCISNGGRKFVHESSLYFSPLNSISKFKCIQFMYNYYTSIINTGQYNKFLHLFRH